MAELLETLKRKIDSAEDMHSVVKTMQSLAAVNIRLFERAAESVGEYSRAIEMGLQIVMKNTPEGITTRPTAENARSAVIIFGSAQGMSGDFNERILTYAVEKMEELQISREHRVILALGERLIGTFEEAGHPVQQGIPITGSLIDITPMVQEMLIRIEESQARGDVEQVILFYNRRKSGASFEPCMLQLYPVSPEWLKQLKDREWDSRALPTFTMDWNRLFSLLIRQHFFVSLYRAFFESLESENASRLVSMQAAEKNIEERLEELTTRYHRQRQASITAELLDIVAGFEALTGKQR